MSSYASAATGPLQAAGGMHQANTDANISEYNAHIANQDAEIAIAQGNEEARRSLVQSTKMIGAQSAAYGAAGVSQQGSAQWVMSASAAQGELNALTLKHGGEMKAYALHNEANLDMFKAHNQRVAGYLNAATALLGAGAALGKGGSGGSGSGNSGSASADNSGSGESGADYTDAGTEDVGAEDAGAEEAAL